MMMQERERVVLETLEKLPKRDAVLIGGYAVNAYVPPRFSIDCDLVIFGDSGRIEDALRENGFAKAGSGDVPYGDYIRYFRERERVSFDLLVGSVLDRQTGIVFEDELFRKHSRKRVTVGRATPFRIEMRIADPELLFVMKFVTGRRQDIRDVFMLAGGDLDWMIVTEIISQKCGSELIAKRKSAIRRSVRSKSYRDSLHGPYGRMPDERFELCKRHLMRFIDGLDVRNGVD